MMRTSKAKMSLIFPTTDSENQPKHQRRTSLTYSTAPSTHAAAKTSVEDEQNGKAGRFWADGVSAGAGGSPRS